MSHSPKWLQQPELCQAAARSFRWAFYLDTEAKHLCLVTFHCLPRYINREMDQKWNSRDANHLYGILLALQAAA